MWIALALVICAASEPGTDWKKVDVVGCENVFQLSASIYSGGEPHDEAALKALADRGVKTIVSVDGAKPAVETAKKQGLRYIHLPIGYDGFSRVRGLQFGRVLTDVEGPVYFHCHHGQHRGPAAVAAGMECTGAWSSVHANAFLKAAGTAEKYVGIYDSVNNFSLPSKEELASVDVSFPSMAETPPIQETMAHLDRQKDNLALAEKSGWKAPADHPDIAPPHEALQLHETFAEFIRLNGGPERPAPFHEDMKQARAAATALEVALRANHPDAASAAFKSLNQACNTCHEQFRDR